MCILGSWWSASPAAADELEPVASCAIEPIRDRLTEARRRLEVAEDELAKYPLIPSAAVIPAAALATLGVVLHATTLSDRDAPLAYGLSAIPAAGMLAGLGAFIVRSRQRAPFARERAPLLKLEARYDRELREAAHGKCGPPLTRQELQAAIAESERELEQLELRADATGARRLKAAVAALSVATGGLLFSAFFLWAIEIGNYPFWEGYHSDEQLRVRLLAGSAVLTYAGAVTASVFLAPRKRARRPIARQRNVLRHEKRRLEMMLAPSVSASSGGLSLAARF